MRKALLVLAAMASLFLAPLASETQTGQFLTPETLQATVATQSPVEPPLLATSSSGQRDHFQSEYICMACQRECGETGGRLTRFGCACC